MSDRWSFRWRVLLLLAMAVVLVARFMTSRCWVHRSVVVGGGGPPAVIVELSSRKRTILKWDWSRGRMEPVATFKGGSISGGWLCTGDDKFVWFNDNMLHTVDLHSPHERREWKTTLPSEDLIRVAILGTSANSRFVVVQCTRSVSGPKGFTQECHLHVIDLQTGEEVSKKHWHSELKSAAVVGEFRSQLFPRVTATPEEPTTGDWRLTDQGTWELLPPDPGRYDFGDVARDVDGNFRRVSSSEALAPKELRQNTMVEAQSSDKTHFLRRVQWDTQRLFLVHEGRRDVQILPIAANHFVTSCFTDDGRQVVIGDNLGDVHVFDAETGRIVARTRFALIWYWVVVGLAPAFAIISLAWLVLSFRQSSPFLAIIDLHGTAIAAQLAIFSPMIALEYTVAPQWLQQIFAGVAGVATAVFGIAVGWYWTYGRANFISKLKWGGLSIVAIGTVPALALASQDPPEYRLIRLVAPSFAGLFAASVTAFMLSPMGMLGWRASDEPLSFHPRRFGVASIMILIALISAALGFLKLIFSQQHGPDVLDVAMAFLPTAIVGLLLPAIAIMNVGRWWRLSLGLGVATLVFAGMAARSYQHGNSFLMWANDFASYVFAATTALVILGMATLARRQDWRWRKALEPASEILSMERAA